MEVLLCTDPDWHTGELLFLDCDGSFHQFLTVLMAAVIGMDDHTTDGAATGIGDLRGKQAGIGHTGVILPTEQMGAVLVFIVTFGVEAVLF